MGNLAEILRKLCRYNEARQAIQKVITCKAGFGYAAGPWKAWQILGDIETGTGNLDAAKKAKNQAVASYPAYRRDSGDNHTTAGRITHAVTETLSSEGAAAVIAMLQYANSSGDIIPAGKRVSSVS